MKREVDTITNALKSITDKNDPDSLLFPTAFISAMKIVAGEDSVKHLIEPAIRKEYWLADGNLSPMKSNIYFTAGTGLNLLAQAQINMKVLAVEIRESAPNLYKSINEFTTAVHEAESASRVKNGYDDLTLANAETKLSNAIRHHYPAIQAKAEAKEKPKRLAPTPQ
ncbi:hypothetical protein AO073_01365 [Pseudomonas syringae ICMP 11293]|uniref:hypothetical protein n=1 Tax=Pseudomonas syringae TaxID=317 RepID=UPI00073070D1|nr:hypothetical protein [Pseudomonas syringae]KTB91549.1 hypothetical protein AO073_01365 [Pseudomonas syringae ICMP 11293]